MKVAVTILRYLWALPLTMIGFVLAVLYVPRFVRWSEGALDVGVRWIFPPRVNGARIAGQTWGWIICYAAGEASPRLRRHEREHVRQNLTWGPFLAILYPMASLLAWKGGGHFYRDNYFEREARRVAEQISP